MNALQTLVTKFVADLETLQIEATNQRLRDVLSIGLVAAPEKERAAMRAPAVKVAKKSRRKGPRQHRKAKR